MNYDREDNMKAIQYAIVLAAAIIGLAVGGCSLIPWGDVPVPPVVGPPVVTPSADTCTGDRVGYTGTKEQISTSGPASDLRGLVNDHNGEGSWVTDAMLPHVRFDGLKMTVECFDVAPGIRCHYLGYRQPKSAGTLMPGKDVTVSKSGTLRLYWETRVAK